MAKIINKTKKIHTSKEKPISSEIKITSTKFIKGVVGDDSILASDIPQIAFIGRSNVGKSSLINALTNSKISRTSSFPGRTQEINIFLINESYYLVDLPGYGFARASGLGREKIGELIDSYLFNSIYNQKRIVLIIDANVGMTERDITMYQELVHHEKDFIIVANKIDKMTQAEYHKKMTELKKLVGESRVIPFSTKKRKGIEALTDEIFS
ncbi:MAG: ribosome biogenesis GTP-binding protein YihA/YsxC [Candidatus Nomurabacteria bacterium]|nr:ribosome biogenesis GTP-binding protein YihA/YsxC [Candidatus Nomurabacteria bacterium]